MHDGLHATKHVDCWTAAASQAGNLCDGSYTACHQTCGLLGTRSQPGRQPADSLQPALPPTHHALSRYLLWYVCDCGAGKQNSDLYP
jgi:hypothetical protein